ncbi:MAG: hypothetical protein JJ899_04860 [Alphaproteobacteria bacterium]|nr:hypothetical protein [Alphaproteobacteria bacterium]
MMMPAPLKKLARALAACALLAGAATASGAAAETRLSAAGCGDRAAIVERLASQYGEHPAAFGLADFGHVVELFIATNGGTWTVLVSRADGVSCLAAAGRDWQGVSTRRDSGSDS